MRSLQFLLDTYEGRQFLMDMIDDTGALYDPYWNKEDKDYACGKKSVGLDLFHIVLQTDNNSFKVMVEEKNERLRQETLKNERESERRESELYGSSGDESEYTGENGGHHIHVDEKGGLENH